MVGEFLFLTARPSARCHGDESVRRVVLIVGPIVHRLLADPACCHWSFQRLSDHQTGTSVRLSFHATSSVLDELEIECEQALNERGWDTASDRDRARSDTPSDRAAMTFSTLSSELALALFAGGGLPGAAKRAFAVAHLLRMVTLVSVADRATFLFTCWQESSARMSREQRFVITREAKRWQDCPVKEHTELAWDRRQPDDWRRYLDSVEHLIVDAQHAELPVNYLLFDHARMTHNRVGIGPDNEGFAAWLLRSALINGEIDQFAPRELAAA
jgi:hypothetical protein